MYKGQPLIKRKRCQISVYYNYFQYCFQDLIFNLQKNCNISSYPKQCTQCSPHQQVDTRHLDAPDCNEPLDCSLCRPSVLVRKPFSLPQLEQRPLLHPLHAHPPGRLVYFLCGHKRKSIYHRTRQNKDFQHFNFLPRGVDLTSDLF